MDTQQKNTPVLAGAEGKTISKFNYTALFHYIKSKQQYLSRKFWVANYNLETARKEHADLGHLWKQVWYCIVLSVFRLISGVVR